MEVRFTYAQAASAEEGDVTTAVTVNEVVAVTAEKAVGPVATENAVVADAAIDGEVDQGGETVAARE